MNLHNEAKAFDLTIKDVFVAEEQNHNTRYLFIRNQEIENSLIPLLPGFVVFTTAGKKQFKLSILESNNQLLFFWEEFGSDSLYIKKKAQGVGRLAFHCMLKKYEETLYRSLKQDQGKIDDFLCENTSQDILFGIQVELNGKTLSPKPAQALILKSMEYKQTIYFQNKTIKMLKERIISLNGETENEKNDITTLNNLETQRLVEKEIKKKNLGSTIFMSTAQYFSILLSLPCPNCHDLITSNQTFYTTVLGFRIFCVVTCLLCKTSTQYSNEDSGIKYSRLVAGATLSGVMNRNSFQTALATIGVTNQCSKQSYNRHQAPNHLPGQEKVLPVGFDCSWSHARNAHQTSEEFLYLGDLPGNFDGSSRQMKHAILIALLNNIIPILEETDFTLHVCVDEDLETNRTLACIPAVSRIFADLKHVSKNIQKNL
ncbi:hypothetical protein GLOIN_2v1801635 [Rhizophagus irregularis DAOM 181602=DAOM 197198]|nr:hypothetical protein GLOIN_2v1801635 [Rhizophagus irregularis DAOM 181602=DAOM 197198]